MVMLAGRVRAAERTFSLEYSAPAECPDRAAFVRALVSRSLDAREAVEAAVALRISIHGDARRASGTLAMQLRDGQTSERVVPEAPCAEVLTSMAVIAAMVVDGGGLDAPAPSAATVTPVPPGASPATAAEGAPPLPRTPRPPVRRSRSSRARESAPLHDSGTDARPAKDRQALVAAVLAANAETAMAPELAPGLGLGVDVRWRGVGAWWPSVRASIRYAQSGTSQVPGAGSAQFRLIAGSLSGCPVRGLVLTPLGLSACVVVDAGDLRGLGRGDTGERVQHMLWLAFGTAGRAELELTPWLALELEARATLLARGDRFVFLGEPDRVAHDVPRFNAVFSTGVRVGLP